MMPKTSGNCYLCRWIFAGGLGLLAVAPVGCDKKHTAAPSSSSVPSGIPPLTDPMAQAAGSVGSHPELPAGHPELPAGHPELPAGHPELPAGHPELPAGHPELPAGHPELPAGHPELPAGHPELPAGHPTVTEGDELPSGHPAIVDRDKTDPMGAPVDPTRVVTGTIEFPQNPKAQAKPGDALFLSLRSETGELLAVDRINSSHFPAPFSIASSKPARKVIVVVTLDRDGDAMTHQPGDVTGRSPAKLPAAHVVVKLDTVTP
jgi:hypothetical protein